MILSSNEILAEPSVLGLMGSKGLKLHRALLKTQRVLLILVEIKKIDA